jgi:hypothetical protein
MKEQKIVMYESNEAATFKTGISGWVSGDGRFFGNDEHLARYAGSTHRKCDCGGVMSRGWLKCEKCRAIIEKENFNKLPFVEWDGEAAVYSDEYDKYFFDKSDLDDFLYDHENLEEGETIEIDLLICVPNEYNKLNDSYWEDILPEDGEIHGKLAKAIDELNKVIKELPPASWYPGKTRTKYTFTND